MDVIECLKEIHIYDPKVTTEKVYADLTNLQNQRRSKFSKRFLKISEDENRSLVTVHDNPYSAMKKAHGVAILSEWDEFKLINWPLVYSKMMKPAFVFDGKNILDKEELKEIGFETYLIGK